MSLLPRKRGAKCRTCVDCGVVDSVRQDNKSVRCKPCALVATNAANRECFEVRAPRQPNCSCSHCGLQMVRSPSAVVGSIYCSVACRSASCAVSRVCKCCGSGFTTQIGRLSGKTNSTANFCSRPCYEKWLCNTERTKSRGSRWSAISRETIAAAPFCACCGRARGRLETHHILPFRLSLDNTPGNLIPLCSSCHKKIEVSTVELENNGVSSATISWFMRIWLRYRQFSTANILREVSNDRYRCAA